MKRGLGAVNRNERTPLVSKVAEAASRPSEGQLVVRAVVVLLVYCFHNAWNCVTMLTLSADVPAATHLFHISEAQLGQYGTLGVLAIAMFLPVAMLCRWRRTLLFCSALLNLAPVPLRYFAAIKGSFALATATMMAQGCSYGIIAVWPAILAKTFFPEKRWAVVIAVAGLSNYLGGALGAALIPQMTGGTSEGLLRVLLGQSWLALGLFAMTSVWLWIPDVPEEEAVVPLQQEWQACARPSAFVQVLVYGLAIGISITLQFINPFMLLGVGFSAEDAGACNCVYQLAAAVVGCGLGGLVTRARHVKLMIRWLHALAVLSAAAMLALCVLVADRGRSTQAFAAMLVTQALLGASLLGLLPFVTQEVVYAARPATENFVTGLLNVVAFCVPMVLNSLGPAIPALLCARLVFALVLAEALCFVWLDGQVAEQAQKTQNKGESRQIL